MNSQRQGYCGSEIAPANNSLGAKTRYSEKFTVVGVLLRIAIGIADDLMSETALDPIRTGRRFRSKQHAHWEQFRG